VSKRVSNVDCWFRRSLEFQQTADRTCEAVADSRFIFNFVEERPSSFTHTYIYPPALMHHWGGRASLKCSSGGLVSEWMDYSVRTPISTRLTPGQSSSFVVERVLRVHRLVKQAPLKEHAKSVGDDQAPSIESLFRESCIYDQSINQEEKLVLYGPHVCIVCQQPF